MIDVKDWEKLAHKWANKYYKRAKHICEYDDLYQVAITAIWERSLTFESREDKPDEEAFPTYCYWLLTRELNNVVYRTTYSRSEGRSQLTTRDVDMPLSSTPHEIVNEEKSLFVNKEFHTDDVDGEIYAEQIYDKALKAANKIKDKQQRNLAKDLVRYGHTTAVKRYIDKTGNSRQRAGQLMPKVKEHLQEALECYL